LEEKPSFESFGSRASGHLGTVCWLTKVQSMTESIFETSRLRLRSLDDQDVNVFIRWWTDPLFLRDQTSEPIRQWTEVTLLERLKKWASTSSLFFVCESKVDKQIVAQCNLWETNNKFREHHYAVAIAREYWNQGYGREITRYMAHLAFSELNAHRVALRVNADNVRAIRSHTAAGFKVEGRLRHTFFRSGQWQDELIMSVIRGELG
jgi:RimJ/RimL family protein N-acetyltransferase